jgi:hypothetical protein
MATAMTDEWDRVEKEFTERERHGALRTTIAAMRPLIERIKADGSLHDLEPSVSLASLVFRRSAPRSVLVHWDEEDGYQVSLLDPPFEISETTKVSEDRVIDVLRKYLDKAAG